MSELSNTHRTHLDEALLEEDLDDLLQDGQQPRMVHPNAALHRCTGAQLYVTYLYADAHVTACSMCIMRMLSSQQSPVFEISDHISRLLYTLVPAGMPRSETKSSHVCAYRFGKN